MEQIPAGVNPRDFFHRHRERGPKRWEYTYETIAKACGLSVATVKERLGNCWRGHGLAPGDLRWIAAYIGKQIGKRSRPMAGEDLRMWLGGEAETAKWGNRWPLLDVYQCVVQGCEEVSLQAGPCNGHGVRHGWVFGANEHFLVRTSKGTVGYHRLVLGCPAGLDVHHADFNRWNNRRENLVVLTAEAHRRLHMAQLHAPAP